MYAYYSFHSFMYYSDSEPPIVCASSYVGLIQWHFLHTSCVGLR